MKLPRVDVSEPCMFTTPFADTEAYYLKSRQELDELIKPFRFEDRSIKKELVDLVSKGPSPFPCWVTFTSYENMVCGAGLLDSSYVEDVESEYEVYVKSLREMIAHPEKFEPKEVY